MTFISHSLADRSLAELQTMWLGDPPDGEENAAEYYIEIGAVIASRGESAVTYLLNFAPLASEARLQGILTGVCLTRTTNTRYRQLLRSCLVDPRTNTVWKTIYCIRAANDCSELALFCHT